MPTRDTSFAWSRVQASVSTKVLAIFEERFWDLEDGGTWSRDSKADPIVRSPLVDVGMVLVQNAVLGFGVGVVASNDRRKTVELLHLCAEEYKKLK